MIVRIDSFLAVTALGCLLQLFVSAPAIAEHVDAARVELGSAIFGDASLSRDGKISCRSCHDPARAYADPHPRSIGVDGKTGTRNAPSLIGIGHDGAFTWDGRRTRLEDVVTDPFTNPIEFGLTSNAQVMERLRKEPDAVRRFKAAFPDTAVPTIEQVGIALVSFVRSLKVQGSAYDRARTERTALSGQAQLGSQLFDGIAGCSVCHTHTDADARFSDGQYHHSGIGDATQSRQLPELVQAVLRENRNADSIGPKVLSDAHWSALGRFVVTHDPKDIAAFRTPSLRNVAVTAPYMHDGSIATLREAVDHEVYYRGFSTGHPVNLTDEERQALVAFLDSLTDAAYVPRSKSLPLAK